MKKVLFALLMISATAMVFTSCKKDKDDDNGGSIVGTWKLTKGVEYYLVDGKLQGEKQEDDLSDENFVITFTSNGKYTTKQDGSVEDEGTYSYSDGKLTIKYDGDTDVVKVAVSGNTLIFKYEDDDSTDDNTIIWVNEEHYTRQ